MISGSVESPTTISKNSVFEFGMVGVLSVDVQVTLVVVDTKLLAGIAVCPIWKVSAVPESGASFVTVAEAAGKAV